MEKNNFLHEDQWILILYPKQQLNKVIVRLLLNDSLSITVLAVIREWSFIRGVWGWVGVCVGVGVGGLGRVWFCEIGLRTITYFCRPPPFCVTFFSCFFSGMNET